MLLTVGKKKHFGAGLLSLQENDDMKKTMDEQKLEIYKQIEEILNLGKKTYNRVLTSEERDVISTDSFGYLLSLYNYGTIDNIQLEKLILCCMYVANRRDEQLNLKRTKSLVNVLLFYDNSLLFVKELIPLLNALEEYSGSESVN